MLKTIFLAKDYDFCQIITNFVPYINRVYMEAKDLNRLKVVLAEKKRTNNWVKILLRFLSGVRTLPNQRWKT